MPAPRFPLALCAQLALTAFASAQSALEPSFAPSVPGNVLLIVLDDVGCDMVASFGQHPSAPPTPVLDQLAANGVSFVNAYTEPTCSPSRACILTGRFGLRSGLGGPIQTTWPEYYLPFHEVTIPERLAQVAPWPVATAAIGKWHLNSTLDGPRSPNLQGFQFFEGTEGNFFFGQNYQSYVKVLNGTYTAGTKYATTDQVDDAIQRIAVMREPWFTYLSFNASHQPFHAPPANLHGYNLSGDPNLTPQEHFRAAVESMDTEIGRLIASIDANVLARTTIVLLSDNGSPNEAIAAPTIPGHNKGTLYEGGVHVPLIISGHGVRQPGTRCYSMVSSVDLYPTVLQLLAVDPDAIASPAKPVDGVSLLTYLRKPDAAPVRDWVFASKFAPNGPGPYTSAGYMVRDARWKLIHRVGQGALFFDMASAQGETQSLLPGPLSPAQQLAYARLKDVMDGVLGP